MDQNPKEEKRFFGLRTKTLLPIVLGGLLILFAAIYGLRYAIYTTGNNILDVKLVTNLAQFTNYGITIDIHYKEGFQGVFSGFTVNINNEDVFNFDWADSEEKLERQRLGTFFVGGYTYSPEEKAFLLEDPFKKNEKLPLRIDSTFEGWHSGTKVTELLLQKGSARFQTEIENSTLGWLGVSQFAADYERPKMILIGTNGQYVDGLMNYLSLTEGAAMIIILLMIFMIVWSVIAKTVGRVRKVGNYLDSVGKGDLPDDLLVIHSQDEIEDMTKIVNDMIIELKDKQRIESELSAAANIQLGMLPTNFTAFSNHHRFDLYATMKPAKEVGGDFYDFFMPDDDHLALVMADVSGKGVPAALFMVMGKTILRGTIKSARDFSEIMSEANKVLRSSNENGLFITVWAGLLDLNTGELTFCNAGHNPPLVMHSNKQFEYLEEVHGTVMGFLKKAKYKQGKITLQPGDKLYLYTDGITEAQNAARELYEEERLRNCLNAHTDLSPKDTLAVVKEDIDAFVNDADQFDDMTMMMLEYLG